MAAEKDDSTQACGTGGLLKQVALRLLQEAMWNTGARVGGAHARS